MTGPTPRTAVAYLQAAADWHVAERNVRRSIWEHTSGARVFIPGGEGPDTAELIDRAVLEVARAEGRDPSDVKVDFTWDQYDRLHVRRAAEGSALPFEVALDLHSSLRDLITAAARSAGGEPRATYLGRRPVQVDDYLDGVQIIPSMPGSFVVRALLPLSTAQSLPLDLPPSDPARRVSLQILKASRAALTTAADVAETGDLQRWDEAVRLGVSSNLCDALARLPGPTSDTAAPVEIRAVWSWAAPVDQEPAVVVGPGQMAPLEAAADYLRGQPETHTMRITGLVTTLHREISEGNGDVTVKGHLEGQDAGPRSLRVNVDARTYSRLIAAHREGRSVTVQAKVRRHTNRLEVLRVIRVRVLK